MRACSLARFQKSRGAAARSGQSPVSDRESTSWVKSVMNVRHRLAVALLVLSGAALEARSALAQCGCGYQIVNKVVYDQVPVTAYRLEYETVTEERQVTTLRPEWTEEMRERRYMVARPVT